MKNLSLFGSYRPILYQGAFYDMFIPASLVDLTPSWPKIEVPHSWIGIQHKECDELGVLLLTFTASKEGREFANDLAACYPTTEKECEAIREQRPTSSVARFRRSLAVLDRPKESQVKRRTIIRAHSVLVNPSVA